MPKPQTTARQASPTTLCSSSLDDALRFDPFEGDMDGDSRILQDKIVTARKPAECAHCAGKIIPGERIRSRKEVFDGEFESYKWCEPCIVLMAKMIQGEYGDEPVDDYERRCRTNS